MLENETALVSGASRGIGRAIALALGGAGARVIGTATSEEGAARISDAFKAASVEGRGVVLDVTTSASVERCLSTVQDVFGAPGLLVNNAGIARDNLLLRMQEDEWTEILNTDLSSIYRMSKACLRGMLKARRGRIINIGSVVGALGNPGQTNYCAAKAGLIGFTKALAREVASRGVTVNAVAPGFIETDMTRTMNERQRNGLTEQIPLHRLGSPEDVAQAVVFLVSPGAAYITGHTLHVNGGMYMN